MSTNVKPGISWGQHQNSSRFTHQVSFKMNEIDFRCLRFDRFASVFFQFFRPSENEHIYNTVGYLYLKTWEPNLSGFSLLVHLLNV